MNIYELAKECGVSVATISRVINGREGVSDATRKRIKQKIQEVGFSPKIKRSSCDTIAVFIPNDKPNPITNAFVNSAIAGISEVTFDNEYIFTIIPYAHIPTKQEEYKHFCIRHQLSGVVFLGAPSRTSYVADFARIIPTAAVGAYFDTEHLVCVGADNENGAHRITEYLISMGHQKIMFAVADMGFQDHAARFQGYRNALSEAGIPFNTNHLLEYDYSFSGREIGAMLDRVLDNKAIAPTSIFCCNDQEVYRICDLLKAKNLSIPQDISVVGFDDYEMSRHFSPRLTTVKQPIEEEGRLAAKKLLYAISHDTLPKKETIFLQTQLMVRDSVKRLV